MKMATFKTPSITERTHRGMVFHTSPMNPVNAVGSRINSPTEKAMPRMAPRVMITVMAL